MFFKASEKIGVRVDVQIILTNIPVDVQEVLHLCCGSHEGTVLF